MFLINNGNKSKKKGGLKQGQAPGFVLNKT
jgi:hypothetical protein